MAKAKSNKKIEIVNRKAAFEYQFLAEFEAGIMLTGTEIKSIREGNVNLKDAYCTIKGGELFIVSLFIAEYKFGNQFNHEPRRTRKLLLRKTELRKIERKTKEKGFTIVPYRLYLSERGLAKLDIRLAQGKKAYDKRESIKARENKRDLDRIKKHYS
ncbi:MAG: SsrA-binding protein SmpB [Bacteroidota bacterium]